MIFQIDTNSLILGKVCSIEGISWERRFIHRKEPIWVFNYPFRINSHVIRHHVCRKPDIETGGPIAEILVTFLSTKRIRYGVVI